MQGRSKACCRRTRRTICARSSAGITLDACGTCNTVIRRRPHQSSQPGIARSAITTNNAPDINASNAVAPHPDGRTAERFALVPPSVFVQYAPVPGIPTVLVVLPVDDTVTPAPRPPKRMLLLFLLRFSRMPGAILMVRRNRKGTLLSKHCAAQHQASDRGSSDGPNEAKG